jgi:hypothetical protein
MEPRSDIFAGYAGDPTLGRHRNHKANAGGGGVELAD